MSYVRSTTTGTDVSLYGGYALRVCHILSCSASYVNLCHVCLQIRSFSL